MRLYDWWTSQVACQSNPSTYYADLDAEKDHLGHHFVSPAAKWLMVNFLDAGHGLTN
jgi:hypothetical protein